jgi:integrase
MKGHIRERSPGRWAIVIEAKDSTGKRKRRWHSFKGIHTKREAQIERAKLITEAQNGNTVDPSRISVAEFLDRFERDWIALHTTARTSERYIDSLNHVRKAFGEVKLQAIKAAHLAALYADLGRSGLATATIRHVHVVAHRAFKEAKAWGLLRDNPADMVKPPKMRAAEVKILQAAEAKELLGKLRCGPLYMLASLALGTGARRGELLALRWRDIDFDSRRLTIEQALEQTAEHGIRTKEPKTKHGRRTISLPAHIVAELRAHHAAQAEQRLALGMGRAPEDATVLAGVDGKPLSPDTVSKQWERTMDALGRPEITLHSLRHTHASMLIASGMDILTISRRLGHANPTVTLNVYGHLIAGSDDKAAQIMEAAFGAVH